MKPIKLMNVKLEVFPDSEIEAYPIGEGLILLIVMNYIEVPTIDYEGNVDSDLEVTYHVYKLSSDRIVAMDFQEFNSIYKTFSRSTKIRLWGVYKYLRPWMSLNQLRPRLYKSRVVGPTHDPYLIEYPVPRFHEMLKSNGYEWNPYEDLSKDTKLRKLENLYIRSTYGNLLKGSKSEGK